MYTWILLLILAYRELFLASGFNIFSKRRIKGKFYRIYNIYYIMSEYHCKTCSRTYSSKQAFSRHIASDVHKLRLDQSRKRYTCKCGRTYLHPQSLCNHRVKCKYQEPSEPEETETEEPEVETEESKDQKIESLQKEIEALKAEKQQSTTTIQNANEIINNNNTTNNTQNIHINCYGKEDLSYITTEFLKLLINSPFTSIQTLTRHIHFNDEHPENKNVKVTNRKLPYASIHKDGRWQLTDRSKLTEELMHKKYTFLDTMYEDLEPTLSERCKDKFERFQYKYDTVEEQNKIKKDLDLYLLGGIEPSEG